MTASAAVWLMEYVPSESLDSQLSGFGAVAVVQAALDALVELQSVGQNIVPSLLPIRVTANDEIARWERLMQRAPIAISGAGAHLAAALRRGPPSFTRTGLVHGDFHYGNLLFRQGKVVAVVDWEIPSFGPLQSDLACLCALALRRRFADARNPAAPVDVDVQQISALARAANLECGDLDWYVAAACYKYAAILGYKQGQHHEGIRVDSSYDGLERSIEGLIEVGLEYLRG